MASHYRDDLLHGRDHPDTHASDSRWRHQESSAYSRHASPRPEGERQKSGGFSNLINGLRGKHAGDGHTSAQRQHEQLASQAASQNEGFHVKCGPLLNYRRMERDVWFGSVLIVTRGGGSGASATVPEMLLKIVGAVQPGATASATNGYSNGAVHSGAGTSQQNGLVSHATENGNRYGNTQDSTEHASSNAVLSEVQVNGNGSREMPIRGTKLYSDPANTFWRFDLQVPMRETEIQCEYTIPGLKFDGSKKTDKQHFFIPAIPDSMRIMFHSCNGFSVGTDEEAWSGAALWEDVQRVHAKTPFHVMLGGGDQIYNDGIRVNGPLRKWTDIGNPHKRREFPFPESLRKECDEYYVNNYIRWYSTEPFASANGQIPQLNLWDDHDIIDGFGSYVDDFMRCPVFRGIGGVANKYYLLFQHHLAPPPSTYTTDAPGTTGTNSVAVDQRQLENTYVLEEKDIDSSYIIGSKPGPYVVDHSRSIYARLGSRIAFFGIDARTERTRKQVNYPETYKIIFDRLRAELGAAKNSSSPILHLVVLLGIPIAYPRLTWLENIFSSPIIAPIKFLNKRFGFGGGFFNHFDGSVDLLDDLDDHYTARTHKKERLMLVQQLQALAAEFSVRISILGGDVHLAAVGRFYSNPKLNIPAEQDHRYMANIISSAIVNKPPPQAVANLLARRNKIHHLDPNTDETLMKYFDKDPGNSNKTSNSNHVTMPSRNWAMITENSLSPPGQTQTNGQAHINGHSNGQVNGYTNGHATDGITNGNTEKVLPDLTSADKKHSDGHSPLHAGEIDAGTKHKAADHAQHGKGTDHSLDVCIRVEMDQHDREGKTQAYGMTIPRLVYDQARLGEEGLRKRDALKGALHQKA